MRSPDFFIGRAWVAAMKMAEPETPPIERASPMATSRTDISSARQRRSMVGAFVGTAIEWYDFYIFGTAAALVFGRVFYPDVAPGAALLASFATFWVGFLMRPVGGLVFGHFGDKF